MSSNLFLAIAKKQAAVVTRCSCVCFTPRRQFHEPDKKGGYRKSNLIKPNVKEGFKMIPGELAKLKEEALTKLRCDSLFGLFHGDYEIIWKFDATDVVNSWIVTTDGDNNEGFSKASFVLGPNKTSIFSGHLKTDIPKDGVIKCSGYCNIQSPKNLISFKRERPYEWDNYTHLLVKTRGDGRSYQICLNMHRHFDIQWNDQYDYPLFTRGGPYWQISKIPFSKFVLSSKGRLQDKQEAIQLDQISSLGITVSDQHAGPFRLEIDFIGLVYDETHQKQFEYEMYEVSPTAIYS